MRAGTTGKRIRLTFVLLLIVSFLTGCWDRLEIEERAVVLGIAIDSANSEDVAEEELGVSHMKGRHADPKNTGVKLTVQIAVPGRIPLGPGGEGGGGGGTGGEKRSTWVLQVSGHSMDDAMSNLQQQISATIFLGHLRVIVVSEQLAKRGLKDINDYLRRNPEVRRLTWMVVSKGDAARFMVATPELERVPALYLLSSMEQSVRMGKFPKGFVGKFWSNMSKLGQEAFLPYVSLKEKDNLAIEGMAYFRNDKMVGKTEPLEIGYYLGIKGINPAGYSAYEPVPGSKGIVVFNSINRQTVTKLKMIHGKPHFTVHIFLEGNIREKINYPYELNDATIKKIEQNMSKKAWIAYYDLVKKTQKDGSDIFGFGEMLRAKQPRFWNENVRTKEKWQEMYKDIPIDIKLNVRIRRTYMSAK